MTDKLFTDIDDFRNDLEKLYTDNYKPCFLIGNGVCRYLGAPSWGQVLQKVMDKFVKKEGSIVPELQSFLDANSDHEAGFSYPEIYTSFLLDQEKSKSKDSFKKYLKDILENPATCALLQYVLLKKTQILTPNYDFFIERALGFPTVKTSKIQFSKAREAPNSEVYPYGEYISEKQHKDLWLEPSTAGKKDTGHYITDSCAVWHIHGTISHSKSIMLGFEDYVNAIIHLKKLQSQCPDAENHYAEPWEDNFPMKNSWLRLFFTRPLIIVGCSINSQEMFLRWLLLRRQRQDAIRRTKNPNDCFQMPVTYYLDTQVEADRKTELDRARQLYFKSLGIKIIRVKDYLTLYDGQQWK